MAVMLNPAQQTYGVSCIFPVVGGATYALSGWVAGSSSNSAAAAIYESVNWCSDPNTCPYVQVGYQTMGATTGWQQFQRNLTTPANTLYARIFWVLVPSTPGDKIYIDDVGFAAA